MYFGHILDQKGEKFDLFTEMATIFRANNTLRIYPVGGFRGAEDPKKVRVSWTTIVKD